MSPDELAALELRVGNGTTWLAEHDPGSVFHTWWQAGLNPLSALLAQEDGRRAEWAEYFRQRQLWEQLERRLSSAEGRVATHPPTVLPWRPEPIRP